MLLGLMLVLQGCAYRITSRGVEGALAELGPDGRGGGVDALADHFIEREIVQKLGHQLGTGLKEGAAEITPEQQAEFESLIDALITTAATKSGAGLRNEVSPELRAMVRRDITGAFSDGLRGEMADSAEETVQRIVRAFMEALKESIEDPEMQVALGMLFRESIYTAMREEQGTTPAVGDTLKYTMQDDLLVPMENSADRVAHTFDSMVREANRRTENTLRSIVGALIIILSVLVIMYWVRGRQLQRQRDSAIAAEQGMAAVDAALSTVLDSDTRRAILGKADEFRRVAKPGEKEDEEESRRSDQYMRRR